MSGIDNFLSAMGGIGNAAGVQGDGPGGLNALQRAALTPQQSNAYTQQSALSKLASDPNFQSMAPADQQAQILQVTGDPAAAQKVSALSQLSKMQTGNPQQFIQQGVQNGTVTPSEALPIMTNPMMMMGGMGTPPVSTSNAAPIMPQSGGAGVTASSPVAAPSGDPRNFEYLKTIPPALQSTVKGISDGDENALNIASRSPYALPIMAAVKNFDPSYQATNFNERNTMAKSMGGGKIYDFSTAANKAVPHSAQLIVAHEEQGNGDNIPAVNAVSNYVSSAMGDNPTTNFDAAKTTFTPEMAKFTAGVGGSTEGDRQKLDANFSPNMSDKQLTGALSTKLGMGLDAVDSVENDASKVMGRKIQVLTPENRALAGAIQGYSKLVNAGLKSSPQAQALYAQIKQSATSVQPSTQTSVSAQAVASPAPTAQPALADLLAEKKRRMGK